MKEHLSDRHGKHHNRHPPCCVGSRAGDGIDVEPIFLLFLAVQKVLRANLCESALLIFNENLERRDETMVVFPLRGDLPKHAKVTRRIFGIFPRHFFPDA